MELDKRENIVAKRYRDNAIARRKEYYQRNKEKLEEKARIRYQNMTKEQNDRQVQLRREWLERQTPKKGEELKAYMKEYHKNQCHNNALIVSTWILISMLMFIYKHM